MTEPRSNPKSHYNSPFAQNLCKIFDAKNEADLNERFPPGEDDEAFLGAGGLARNMHPRGGRYVYQNMPVVVYPDDSAIFQPALYDTATFENLLGDGFYYECKVDDGREGATRVYA